MHVHTLKNIIQKIKNSALHKEKFVIAISGFGGAGKSTFAQQIADGLKDVTLIHLDDFIINRLSVRSSDWEGFDWDRLKKEVLNKLKKEGHISYGVYNWKKDIIDKKIKMNLKKYIIIEGVGLIKEELNKYYDYTIWIDVPLPIASSRGKKRDKYEYGVDHDVLWDTLWTPNDKDYYEKHTPHLKANICFSKNNSQ